MTRKVARITRPRSPNVDIEGPSTGVEAVVAGSAAEELDMRAAELFAMELNSSAAAMTTMATAGNQWRARRMWVGYHDRTSPMKRL